MNFEQIDILWVLPVPQSFEFLVEDLDLSYLDSSFVQEFVVLDKHFLDNLIEVDSFAVGSPDCKDFLGKMVDSSLYL